MSAGQALLPGFGAKPRRTSSKLRMVDAGVADAVTPWGHSDIIHYVCSGCGHDTGWVEYKAGPKPLCPNCQGDIDPSRAPNYYRPWGSY